MSCKGPNKMTDYVFKVKLLLADLEYPAFYYRQSVHPDKLKCCFEDLRKELMRRYDLRPILDVKTNFKFQWYYDGDMITVSNNDDLSIFMELKGTRLVVVRTQMDGRFFGFNTSSQLTLNTAVQYKPDSYASFAKRDRITSGVSSNIYNTKIKPISSMGHNCTEAHKSIDREILNLLMRSVPSPMSDQSEPLDSVSVHDVLHVENNQPNESDDSTPIVDLVSNNSGIHVEDDQLETRATQETVSQTFPTMPYSRTAGVNVEDAQQKQKRTGNVSLVGDSSRILDKVSVNAGSYGENDQPNPTGTIRKSIVGSESESLVLSPEVIKSFIRHNCTEAHKRIDRDILNMMRPVPSTMSDQSEPLDSVSVHDVLHVENNQPNESDDSTPIVDLVSNNSGIHVEDDQLETRATQETVSQTFPTMPYSRTAGVNFEDAQQKQKRTGNVSLVGDSSRILDKVSVNAGSYGENDQPNPTGTIRKSIVGSESESLVLSPEVIKSFIRHNCTEAHKRIDRDILNMIRPVPSTMLDQSESSDLVSVHDVLHVGNNQLNASNDSTPIVDLVTPISIIHVEDDQQESTSATQETVPQTFSLIPDWPTANAGVYVKDYHQNPMGNVSWMGDSSRIFDSVSVNVGSHAENVQPKRTETTRKTTHRRDNEPFLRSVRKSSMGHNCAEAHKIIDRELLSCMKLSNSMSNPKPKSSPITNSVSVNAKGHNDDQVAVSKIMERSDQSALINGVSQDGNNRPNASGDSTPIVDLVSVNASIPVGNDQSESATATQRTVQQTFSSILDSQTADGGLHIENDQLKHTEIVRKSIVGRWNDSLVRPPAVRKTVSFELPTVESNVRRDATVTSSVSSNRNTLSHHEIMAKLENILEFRKQRSVQPPLKPGNFSIPPPQHPTPAAEHTTNTVELQQPAPELPKHPNLRVRAALNTMTSVMQFSNSGGWLERLLEAVDGDINEALKKLRPNSHLQTSDL